MTELEQSLIRGDFVKLGGNSLVTEYCCSNGALGLFKILLILSKRTTRVVDNLLVVHCYRPLQWTVILFVIRLVLLLTLSEGYYGVAYLA